MKIGMMALLPAAMGLAAPAIAAQAANETTASARGEAPLAPPIAPAASVAASDQDFSACDGYNAPRGKSDGIARETFMFGAATRSADIRRNSIYTFGEKGFAACERALQDTRLIDAFWLRRANLLQAQAVHAVWAGQAERAIELTSASDALGVAQKDGYFLQSIGVGNRGVRAYALIALGRRDEALAAIAEMRAGRPWSQSIRQLAMRLHMHLDKSFAAHATEMKDAIPLSPESGRALFWMLFLDGDLEAARAIAPTISFDLPKQRGGWTLRDGWQNELEEIGQRATVQGAHAYTEAAAGNTASAKAALAEAKADLDEAMAPPPPRADGKPPKKQDVEEYGRRLPYARRAKNEIELWEAAIDLRPKIATRPGDETHAEFIAKGLDKLPIIADILANLPTENAAEKAELDAVRARLRSDFDAERVKALDFPAVELMALLPRPETSRIVPTLKPAGDGYFLSDSGLSRNQEGKSDTWTIRYTHNLAPIAAVEELAMLGAAQTARREGYDSMILLSRLSISRTTNVSGMYVGSYQQNSGYEAQMRVRFVNAGALPADLAGMEWRLIPAQKAIDDLSGRYKTGGLTIAW
jgi:hypothetical protein